MVGNGQLQSSCKGSEGHVHTGVGAVVVVAVMP